MITDLFQSCGHCWVFQVCWHTACSTFTASSFRIWNSSTGIPSPPRALFIVMLSKAHLTSHSRMSGSRWVITPSWLSGSWRSFCTVLLCILSHQILSFYYSQGWWTSYQWVRMARYVLLWSLYSSRELRSMDQKVANKNIKDYIQQWSAWERKFLKDKVVENEWDREVSLNCMIRKVSLKKVMLELRPVSP